MARGGLVRAATLFAVALSAMLAAAAPVAADPLIAAHRGGTYVDGAPRFAENTMPAFRHAGRHGFILEFDVKRTADDKLVVFHDDTLDRVTPCHGRIRDRTLAQLARCPVDVLGSPGSELQPVAPFTPNRHPAAIPTLRQVLAYARTRHLYVSPEIKNQPTDSDFDPTPAFATQVIRAIVASRFPPSHLLIQSFWPPNLTVARQLLPQAEIVLLSLKATNDGAPSMAGANGWEWVGPELGSGFADPQYASSAHDQGRRVIAFTPDTRATLATAADEHVDAVFTDDPLRARRVFARAGPRRPRIPPPPTRGDCRRVRASRTLAPIEALYRRSRAPRVFAMQYKQDPRNVETYRTFRTKIECMIRDFVRPRLAHDRPNVVAFNEDVGLATIATGGRGKAARDIFAHPGRQPSCEAQGAPCATLAAFGAISAAYSPQLAAYRARFPTLQPVSGTFVAATDTFARGWMQTFSDMARRYGVYILGSNDQAPFRESTDPSEIAQFAEPGTSPASVFVATSPHAYNEVFMWGPHDVDPDAPTPLRNVVARNRKVPLTSIEEQFQLTTGPAGGPDAIENLRPYRLPGTRARIGFATSLPAFQFGHARRGRECDDVRVTYMRCLDRLGANVVMQDEANPGRWGADSGCGGRCWQPLEWMRSGSRQVTDDTVRFDYNVTPAMVGNLADLAFDLQSSISQRGSRRGGCSYVGNRQSGPSDPRRLRRYRGRRPEFLALAPWVVDDRRRSRLRATAARLAPGSGDALEDDYLETALIADLPFPVNRSRRCHTAPPPRLR